MKNGSLKIFMTNAKILEKNILKALAGPEPIASKPSFKKIKIKTLADILNLSPEEFERFLPEIRAWYYGVNSALRQIGTDSKNSRNEIVWHDNGQTGDIDGIRLTAKNQNYDLIKRVE